LTLSLPSFPEDLIIFASHYIDIDLLLATWTKADRYHSVTIESPFQIVHGLRQKIEPYPNRSVYVVNWRGKPEVAICLSLKVGHYEGCDG